MNIKLNIILPIIIIILILSISIPLILWKKEKLKFNQNQVKENKILTKTNTTNIFKKLSKYAGKKKYVIICSSGPSLKDLDGLKQKLIDKGILDDAYVIGLKSSVNYLNKLGIRCDFFASNFMGAFSDLNKDLLNDNKMVKVCLDYKDETTIDYEGMKQKCDYIIGKEGNWYNDNNILSCIMNDKQDNCAMFSKDQKIRLGHIFMELAIPIALLLKPKNILTIGWDLSNNKYYNNETNFVKNCGIGADTIPGKEASDSMHFWGRTQNLIKFSSKLPKYLQKYYGISIYKLSDKSCAEIPLFNL